MEHRDRLAAARLYLIGDLPTLARVLDGALAASNIVQVRSPDPAPAQLAAVRDRCRAAGALFIVNDDPALAAAIDADGVHVGQDDVGVSRARELVGAERLIGLLTHSQAQIDAAAGVDYIGVGPVWATPTKPTYAPSGSSSSLRAAHARVVLAMAGSTRRTSARCSRPVHTGSPSSGRSGRRVIRGRRRARSEGRPELSAPRRRKTRPASVVVERPMTRGEARDAAARAQLEPLAPGERPFGLLAAIVVACALALGNLIAYLAGATINGKHPGPSCSRSRR